MECEGRGGDDDEFVVSWRRWLMLGLFAIPSIMSGAMFLTFASISDVVEDRYDVSGSLVNAIGQVFYTIFLIMLPFGLVVLNKPTGLREATLITSVINTVASGLRVPSTFLPSKHVCFALLTASNVVAATGQPYFLVVPTLISRRWFPKREHGIATAIAALVNQVGMALGYFLTRIFVDRSNFDHVMLWINVSTFVVALCTAVLIFTLFENEPPRLVCQPGIIQSPADDENERKSLLPRVTSLCSVGSRGSTFVPPAPTVCGTVRHLYYEARAHCSWYFLHVAIAGGFAVSTYWTFGLLLDSSMSDRFSSSEIAASGCILFTSGIPGMVFAGVLLDRVAAYKQALLPIYVAATVTCAALTFLLADPGSLKKFGFGSPSDDWKPPAWTIWVGCGSLGFFLGAVQPVMLELGVDCTRPLAEELSSALVFLAATQIGFALVFISELFGSELGTAEGAFYFNLFTTCFCILFIATLSVSPNIKRGAPVNDSDGDTLWLYQQKTNSLRVDGGLHPDTIAVDT
ncbi:putative MFS-type transporter C09D4.1 [Diplonema papillatum]|nr:putative MFS-type transporter C09D4.1 [Diplonema papillatum]|eukprot:gene2941-4624_t